MAEEIPYTSLVPGLKYTIISEYEDGDLGYDIDSPYTGVFVSRNGIRTIFRDVKSSSGEDQPGGLEFGREHYYVQDAIQRGRDLTRVKRLGALKNLPEDVESVIGSFITNKKGSTNAQMDKLRQDSGISLAPRAGRRKGVITMRQKDYLREHHHLFNVLSRPTKKKLLKELASQKKELKERGFKGGKTRRRHS
jgi:hypothetical protein